MMMTGPSPSASQPTIPAPSPRSAWARLLRWDLAVPCLLVVLYASPLILYKVPANFDTLTESYEPLKTLKFVHSKGSAFHKWGPMPAFVYAPVYAAPLAYWHLTGDLGKINENYPYGFTRPHEQAGVLIVLARLTGLTLGVIAVAYLGWALAKVTGSRMAAFLTLLLCVSTSPLLVTQLVATKPDGLMLAFLGGAMGVYTLIVSEGLTRRKGMALSILAVFSISCKELSAPAFVLPYFGIAIAGWCRSRGNAATRRRFLADYAVMIAAGFLAYAAINVIYAPSTWMRRMHEWISGPGKDPAVWAAPGYTSLEYLRDIWSGFLRNFDAGGLALFGLAVATSAVAPVRHRLMLWLPSISYLGVVVATAGYMPEYFISPVNLTAAPAVAAALAYLGSRPFPLVARVMGGVALGAMVAFNVWGGTAAWALVRAAFPWTHEHYCLGSAGKDELIFTGNMYARQPGADRLSYLGFNVDDRSLGEIMEQPQRMPDLILVDRALVNWIGEFEKRPARNKMMKTGTGFSYDQFQGFEPLGYQLTEIVHPHLSWPMDERVFTWYAAPPGLDLMVYRRKPGSPPPSVPTSRTPP
jgi:hypothetical protein